MKHSLVLVLMLAVMAGCVAGVSGAPGQGLASATFYVA